MGTFKRNKRIVSDHATAACDDCDDKHQAVANHDRVRMWARRHADAKCHSVNVTIVTIRKYLPKEQ